MLRVPGTKLLLATGEREEKKLPLGEKRLRKKGEDRPRVHFKKIRKEVGILEKGCGGGRGAFGNSRSINDGVVRYPGR